MCQSTMIKAGDFFVTNGLIAFNLDPSGTGHIHQIKGGHTGIVIGFNDEIPNSFGGARWCVFFIDSKICSRFVHPDTDDALTCVAR